MLSYSDIVKKSYRITMSRPLLWIFGLFVVGGFNLNFLNYENIPLRRLVFQRQFLEAAAFFQSHPGALALASLSLLLFTLGGLLVSNWSRIMLILLGRAALKTTRLDFKKQLGESPKSLWTVIQISLLTSGLIFFVALALFLPVWFLNIDPAFISSLILAGAIVFLPLLFVISCINIFTTFYAVSYDKPLRASLSLGTDLFVSRWTQILGLVMVLMAIYLGAFSLGVGLIYLARFIFELLFLVLARFNILSFSAIIIMLKFISNALLWFLLGILSVFFNQALLILFFELSQPVEAEETTKATLAMPAH